MFDSQWRLCYNGFDQRTVPGGNVSEKLFDTIILDAALEQQREALEQERQQVVDRVLQLLDQWRPAYGIRPAYLFGSVARTGRFQQHSDVDLAQPFLVRTACTIQVGITILRVCMLVINTFTRDTRVHKEAKTLAQAGHAVTVFALHDADLPESEIRDGYLVERIDVRSRQWCTSLPTRLLKYLEFNVRAIHRIARLRPAVVHAHDVNALIPGYAAARLSHARLVYDAHELWAERHAPLLQSDLMRRLLGAVEGILARRADAVITVNPSIADLLARRHRLSPPVVLMHCQEYGPVEHNNILRRELNIPADQRIVIYAGLLAPGRGLETLIEASAYLDQAVVVLMGPDRMNGQIGRLIADRGLQDRVLVREPVPPEDVSRYVASADLGVIPTQNVDLSYYYGAGNKLFHYLAAGIPAAVSDQPEKRRIVETYGVGAVFDQTDPRDIARVINNLLNDKETYQAMCRRARQVTRDTLNWRVESRNLLALYDQLLETDTATGGDD